MAGSNTLNIVLTVQPSDLNIWDGIENLIQISGVNGISGYTVTQNAQGQIIITCDYDSDIDGQDILISIDPANDPNGNSTLSQLARVSPSLTRINLHPDNNQPALYYSEDVYNLADSINKFTTAVAALGLVMFFLGMIAGKMIGVEMMAVLQVSFIGLISLTDMNPCFSALFSLYLVNGFNSVSGHNSLEDSLTPYQPKGIKMFSLFL